MEHGRRVAGRYHLIEPIGRGGMGVVWRAHDDLLDRPVAVKEVLHLPASEDDRAIFIRRTMREARAAGRVSHPNVIVVHDVIEEDGHPWIVMQLVQARSLGEILRDHGPLVPDRVASIGLQVLDALCTAHAAGVLHRDVKPENVLIGPDNRVVLTDFGIATMPEESTSTMTGSITGTPAFLPPERLNGRPATPESDLWSLGATLYAAVEGRPPFERSSPVATMAAILNDEPAPPRRAGELTPVLHGLLRKDPLLRMDAAEAADLLRAAMPGRSPAPGGTTGPSPARSTAPDGTTRLPSNEAPAPPGGSGSSSRARLLTIVLVPLLVAAAAFGGWYGYHSLAAGDSATGSTGGTTTGQPASEPIASPSQSPSPSPSPSPSQSPSETPAQSPPPSPSPPPSSAGPDDDVPAGWSRHDDPLGFSVALPDGWTAYDRKGRRVWFRKPGSRDYLLIDLTPWTDADPVAAMRTVERTSTRLGLLKGYARIRLDAGTYLGVPSADWEFTHTPPTGRVRVLDRAFRLPDGRCFAIYWQVADARWTTGLPYFQTFADTFRP
ncbi:serine/threonine protein kinase [Microbispora sp. RL4-1S]|uniref:non-specific serine/threonine protein kinase n=1 Tax=Microbispora oryzae TaxID=2806554 RepID=A0A940WIR6_9ACTN|nr:serine/threonine-protein kinase [Microbispora oryzae]MBP2702330.1 serine/threonine protein kinase [Microbispora oryzae]